MKLVFVSNYFNHQQKPLCDRLYANLGEDFVFIATKPMREERKKLGYGMAHLPEYVFCAYDPEKQSDVCLKLIEAADVVIAGSAPEMLIKSRIKLGKIVIRYSERPLKNGFSYIKYLPRFIKWHLDNPCGKPIYMLCASAYASEDYGKFFLFRNRMYKWGYFPEYRRCDSDALMSAKKENEILWCGRFIDWKHPEDALLMAQKLMGEGIPFKLKFVGTGEMEDCLKNKSAQLGLGERVEFMGSMPPEKVREHMENAQIYIATSDYKEGWGAVINEAMSSGCAVVASHAMGSVPFLIRIGENGFIYESGNIAQLTEKVKTLLLDPKLSAEFGKNAYGTIAGQWNGDIAGERLLEFMEAIISGKSVKFPDGPLSTARPLKNNWIKNN